MAFERWRKALKSFNRLLELPGAIRLSWGAVEMWCKIIILYPRWLLDCWKYPRREAMDCREYLSEIKFRIISNHELVSYIGVWQHNCGCDQHHHAMAAGLFPFTAWSQSFRFWESSLPADCLHRLVFVTLDEWDNTFNFRPESCQKTEFAFQYRLLFSYKICLPIWVVLGIRVYICYWFRG